MTNRYITDAEKAGHKRRVQNYLGRLETAGIHRRQMLVTDAELTRLKSILATWRGEPSGLDVDQSKAATVLAPPDQNKPGQSGR